LQPDRRFLFEEYKVTDVALKVVGVGSVGLRCYVVLLLNDNKERVFIRVKEARQSVLEPSIFTMIFPDSSPLAIGKVWPPFFPVCILESCLLGIHK